MRRGLLTLALAALMASPLHADITIVLTMTTEGPMAGAMGGAMPTMTMRIKGSKVRTDVEMQGTTTSTLTDLDTKEVYVFNAAAKTAQLLTASTPSTAGLAVLDKMQFAYKTTGQKRTIEGVECDEATFTLNLNLTDLAPPGAAPPPEAAEAMKGVTIVANGSIWAGKSGPGAAEFIAFQKKAVDAQLMAAVMGGKPGGGGAGLDKLIAAATSAPGIPYLSEVNLSFEGTGPLVDMMKALGPLKMVQKTTSVKTDALSDDLFKIPADYKVEKK